MQPSCCVLTVVMYQKPVLIVSDFSCEAGQRGVPSREKNKRKRGVRFVPTYCTYECLVSSTSLVFDFGCSFSLVTAKGGQKRQGSVNDLNTDGS